jgi:8-oxo-dGTP pyrophosphatase MutT (NUDIX family)
MSMHLRNAAKAVIIRDGYLLTTKNVGVLDNLFYLLPGGGQNPGETLTEAIQRECMEELGVSIQVGELLFVREYIADNHEFAHVDGGIHAIELMFRCALDTEDPAFSATLADTYQIGVEWLPLAALDDYPLYPQALKPYLAALAAAPPALKTPIYLGDVN